jgi:beta-phosphoglucomutase
MRGPAVIFDMDGVLADTYQSHFASWRQLYGELGREYGEAAFAADFGRTSRDILRRTLDNGLTDEQVRDLDQRKEAYFREFIRSSPSLAMDGAIELIDALRSDGFLLAVGSSGPPENIELMLKKLGRAESFSAIVTGADVTRGKPDPQVFQLAAARLGVAPAACVVIEDAVHGVEAARRGGMKSVALAGTASREELDRHADRVVLSLRQITPGNLRKLLAERGEPRAKV